MMSKPDRLYLGIYTWSSLIEPANVEAWLSAFESHDGLKPTHWYADDDPEDEGFSGYQPYSRDALIQEVSSLKGLSDPPSLCRREIPQYTALLRNTHLNFKSISVDFDKKIRAKDIPEICTWAGSLVSNVNVEVAFLEPAWDNIDYDYEYTTGTLAENLYNYGLRNIAARTWLGAYLVGLIGRERLHNCGGYAQDIEAGGVMLDLVKDPLQTDAQTLTDAQKEVKENLESTGVFGNHTGVRKLGANWAPFPVPARSL
jgi:hypothetical protein